MTPRIVRLPWNGQFWHGRMEDGLPTFGFRDAPAGLVTRRQLRAAGLCPGGRGYVAQLKWRGGRRWAALYLLEAAVPSPGSTTPQLVALWKANRALRTCRDCGRVFDFRLPTSNGRRCWDCDQDPDEFPAPVSAGVSRMERVA
ncbi:RRQRL motif-containing zinc-binding protein [Actinokineospora iranica]|uniref:Uncharacterized protein n=1 Tax=Actinokineospora iranica TaxID=1271860 RepID=A0A1G6YWQ6_9PSEU|nr:RRQRL motif-containing zinc-binding protein [Actinokineospora iranica]SDD94768.1 hypothetical protein SAMN05216174_12413 [Actinokineospora iranica]